MGDVHFNTFEILEILDIPNDTFLKDPLITLHLQCLVSNELRFIMLVGVLDKENCKKFSSIRKDKKQIVYKMTSARIQHMLLGWVEKCLRG